MSYQQASITVEQDLAETLSDALMEAGALSVAIEDAVAGTAQEEPVFGEPGMEQTLWRSNILTALFDTETDVAAVLLQAAAAAGWDAPPPYRLETLADTDWVRLTQAQFEPIQISERLWITPTWHDTPDPAALNLRLDPGVAFGTGSHPTTRLCLQWLDTHLRGGEEILDYGCGSGILAIAALKLGAARAAGVDIDPQAVAAARDNAAQNGVSAQAAFYLPDALPEQSFDLVLANILANPLRMLAGMLAARTRTGGRIVLSGILQEQAEEMCAVYAPWFELDSPVYEQGWACLSGTRRAE
ncbi:MAG: 50S ribosomal protein L11 methyltransferase [Conchiformibius sp.]|nr:50S ribosomal protein L11 methyltransferase [Conchiformibius sp.]